MTLAMPDLIGELKTLRKGRGLFVSQIGDRVGDTLRTVCAVTDEDGPAEIRQKVGDRLENLARNLPADLRVAVMAAFAIAPDARLPLYQDRVSLAAAKLNRDPRTARRRIDDGIQHIAQLAAALSPIESPRPMASTEWHTAQLRVDLALDRERPEVLDCRTIVADRDDLRELDLAMTVSIPGTHGPAPHPRTLGVDLFHGGTLVARGMESSDRFAFSLVLPRPLARGETHDFAMHVRLPADAPLRPYFACVLKHPCALLDLRVRFDRARLPARVWLLRDAFQRDVNDAVPPREPVRVDEAGEIRARFGDLNPGMAYGARWDW
jgi:hypothetical protein